MSYPHRIRLRGPWECGSRRVIMPCRGDQLGVSGGVQLARSFGYPGRLDEFEHVWLTFTGVSATADIAVNDHMLATGQSGSFEHEITPLLGPRNRLEMTLTNVPAGPLWEEVALEIRRAAFLRAGAHQVGPDQVEVRGVVIGPAGTALELYAQVGGRHAHYQVIEPEPGGRPFEFTLMVDPGCASVALDLVQVATSWYAIEVPVT